MGKTSLEKGDREAHDTAAKGARSDFLSVAAKLLGEAFGIFLYDKGDPAHTESYVAAHANGSAQAATTNETSVAQEVSSPAPVASATARSGMPLRSRLPSSARTAGPTHRSPSWTTPPSRLRWMDASGKVQRSPLRRRLLDLPTSP